MTITNVRLDKPTEENRLNNEVYETSLIAKASVTLDYNFVIHNIKVLSGKGGVYIVFPIDRVGKPIAYPKTEECRLKILDSILEKLKEED